MHRQSRVIKRLLLPFIGFLLLPLLCNTALARGFQLFGSNWSPVATNKMEQGWQHVYLCHGCKLTPSLTITTTDEPISAEPLVHEFKKVYKDVVVEPDILRGFKRFNAIRASTPTIEGSPEKITYLITRYFSVETKRWHYVQALIEASSSEEGFATEERWLNLLAYAEVTAGQLVLLGDVDNIQIDISRPNTSMVTDFVERFGAGRLLAGGAALSTTAVLIYGTRVTLGTMGVRGLCGRELHNCKCTDVALSFFGLPVLKFKW